MDDNIGWMEQLLALLEMLIWKGLEMSEYQYSSSQSNRQSYETPNPIRKSNSHRASPMENSLISSAQVK